MSTEAASFATTLAASWSKTTRLKNQLWRKWSIRYFTNPGTMTWRGQCSWSISTSEKRVERKDILQEYVTKEPHVFNLVLKSVRRDASFIYTPNHVHSVRHVIELAERIRAIHKLCATFVRIIETVILDKLANKLHDSNAFSVANDSGNKAGTSDFVVRIWLYSNGNGDFHSFHFLAAPIFKQKTAANLFRAMRNFLDILCTPWRKFSWHFHRIGNQRWRSMCLVLESPSKPLLCLKYLFFGAVCTSEIFVWKHITRNCWTNSLKAFTPWSGTRWDSELCRLNFNLFVCLFLLLAEIKWILYTGGWWPTRFEYTTGSRSEILNLNLSILGRSWSL